MVRTCRSSEPYNFEQEISSIFEGITNTINYQIITCLILLNFFVSFTIINHIDQGQKVDPSGPISGSQHLRCNKKIRKGGRKFKKVKNL